MSDDNVDLGMNKTSKAIEKVYEERKDFLIIGLTGRTGSGCTTVASILKREFKALDLRTPKEYDFHNSDERKYSIIYKYAMDYDIGEFTSIEVSGIITSFLCEYGFDKLLNYFVKDKDNLKLVEIEAIKEELKSLEDGFKAINTKLIDSELNNDKFSVNHYADVSNIFECLIPSLTKEIKEKLIKYSCSVRVVKEKDSDKDVWKDFNLYTYLYQSFGNNLRASGNPYENDFSGEHFFIIARRISRVIKSIGSTNKGSHFFCIDSIRNPYEAVYFRDRFSAFYLMSISTENDIRHKRLSKFNRNQIEGLDYVEYNKKIKGIERFRNQNISECIQISDIHIYNNECDNKKYYFLTEQLIKYIVLMLHPGLITPTSTERCMQMAYNAKLNSGCLSRQVGAVVTGKDYSIKAVGWNDVPGGQVPCNLRDVSNYCKNSDADSYSQFEINNNDFSKHMINLNNKIKNTPSLKGRFYSFCFKDMYNKIKNTDNQVYTRALHAEENAFLQISKYGGVGVQGGILFTTASPCELCAKKSYQLGIKRIIYIDPYPGISETHILSSGKNNPRMEIFFGAIGNAYLSLYTQRIAFKDELSMIINE